ncbi:reverse transcriptase [Moniliophthora roreri MCA 2997]|uniref:Reverse transcriptase n=1 Tax=Moniliophthora roreri (strain MCA 2997) TaxID=1381753 RepID=V2W2D7_MONRO|nr:reverse transcriptase [Moniliophthora roreri MCA 2997]
MSTNESSCTTPAGSGTRTRHGPSPSNGMKMEFATQLPHRPQYSGLEYTLTVDKHAKLIVSSCKAAVSNISILTNTVRGLHQSSMCQLYIACVLPRILYACAAWWKSTQYQIQPLEKVQCRALCLICAAFHTTSIEALQIEASIPPICHNVELRLKKNAIQFNKLPKSHPIIQQLLNTWHSNQLPTEPPPLLQRKSNSVTNMKKSTPLLEVAKCTAPSHERLDPYLEEPWTRSE